RRKAASIVGARCDGQCRATHHADKPQFGYRFFVQRSVVLHVQQNLDLGWIRCPGPNRCYFADVDSSEEDLRARLYPARVTKIGAIWDGVATQLRVDQVDDR